MSFEQRINDFVFFLKEKITKKIGFGKFGFCLDPLNAIGSFSDAKNAASLSKPLVNLDLHQTGASTAAATSQQFNLQTASGNSHVPSVLRVPVSTGPGTSLQLLSFCASVLLSACFFRSAFRIFSFLFCFYFVRFVPHLCCCAWTLRGEQLPRLKLGSQLMLLDRSLFLFLTHTLFLMLRISVFFLWLSRSQAWPRSLARSSVPIASWSIWFFPFDGFVLRFVAPNNSLPPHNQLRCLPPFSLPPFVAAAA